MTRIMLSVVIIQLLMACKTSHEFDLTNSAPVSTNDAPFIELLVKKRVTNLAGDLEAPEGSTVRVNEVPPTKSLDSDFDKNTFTKIIKAVCDSQVQEIKITSQNRSLVEGQWASVGKSDNYTAQVEIVEGKYTISCSTR